MSSFRFAWVRFSSCARISCSIFPGIGLSPFLVRMLSRRGRKSFESPEKFRKKYEMTYEFGPFRVDERERVLRRDGQLVPLTPKVFDILLVLVQNSGRF